MNNKFCPSCGQEVKDSGSFCINCGFNLNNNTNTNNNVVDNSHVNNNSAVYNDFNNINPETMTMNTPNNGPVVNEYKNTSAIVGLVCGIVGMLCCCNLLISGVGLGFSIYGLNQAKLHNGTGKGMAIAGMVLSIISIVLILIFSGLSLVEEFL